jgi:hypothetical protein
MSDCRHRQGRARYEFSRHDGDTVVGVFGCEKHGECTLNDSGVVVPDVSSPADPDGCDHLGEPTHSLPATCCSDGPIEIRACAVFGECSVKNPTPQVMRVCVRCHRHTQRERPVRVCDGCPDLTG